MVPTIGGERVPEKPLGERVANLEGVLSQVLPAIQRMEGKLDDALDGMQEKGSRTSVAEAHAEIDELQLALEKKADKTELDQVKITMARWSAIGAVLIFLLTYGPKLFEFLTK